MNDLQMMRESEFALMKQQNYQLKNQLSELKNAFDLNRDVLKIITDQSKSTQPRQQMLYQIINRLTNINNQVMISTAELIHEKNQLKLEKQALKRQTAQLKEKICDYLKKQQEANLFSSQYKPTQMHMFFNAKFKQFEHEIKALEEQTLLKDHQLYQCKMQLKQVFFCQKKLREKQFFLQNLINENKSYNKISNSKGHYQESQFEHDRLSQNGIVTGPESQYEYDENQELQNNKSLIPTIVKGQNEHQQQKQTFSSSAVEQKKQIISSMKDIKIENQKYFNQISSASKSKRPELYTDNNSPNSLICVPHRSASMLQSPQLIESKRKYSSNKVARQQVRISFLNQQISRLRSYIQEIEYRLQVFIKIYDLEQVVHKKDKMSLKNQHRKCLETQYDHQMTQIRLLKFAINNLNREQDEKEFMFKITDRKGPFKKNANKMSPSKNTNRRFGNSNKKYPKYQHKSLEKYDAIPMKARNMFKSRQDEQEDQT